MRCVNAPGWSASLTPRLAGFPDYELATWFAVATLAATPAPILARMRDVTSALMADETVRRRLEELGFELLPPLAPEDMLPLIRAEHTRWGAIIRASGARLE